MSDFVTTQRHVVTLANGDRVPALGQGTWYLGDSRSTHDREAQALRAGVASGMTLIDTAEMYGNGRSERLVGDALDGTAAEGGQLREADGTRAKTLDRDELFIVSKVLPSNAGEPDIFDSCDETLENLGVDYLDLYLLHWRGMVPLAETVACMEELIAEGKIRAWGVSNFDTDDMEDLWRVPGGQNCQVNQVLYHPGSRGIEFDLLPWMRDHGVALMAYCPLAQAGTRRARRRASAARCAGACSAHRSSPRSPVATTSRCPRSSWHGTSAAAIRSPFRAARGPSTRSRTRQPMPSS